MAGLDSVDGFAVSLAAVEDDDSEDDDSEDDDSEVLARESVRENPEPLKTTPTEEKSLRRRPSQAGHSVSGSSAKDCTASSW